MAPLDKEIDFATARAMLMLRLRQNVITARPICDAIETVRHENFVPNELCHLAYSDEPVPLGTAEQSWTPLEIARVVSHLELEKKHKTLLIGTGSGYMAAILSRLCRRVFTLERARLFLQNAEMIWTQMKIINITPMQEDGLSGWPLQVSFERIVLCGGVDQVPQPIIDQLTDNGILIAPVRENEPDDSEISAKSPDTANCTLLKISRARDNFHEQNIGNITTTMLKPEKTRAS